MANYATLKAAIQNVVKTNGNNEITGALLQQTLLTMVSSLGANYQFAGVAIPSTNPGRPDQNVMYFAATAGMYTNFGGIVVNDGEACFLCYDGTWTKKISGAAAAAQVDELRRDVTEFLLIWKPKSYIGLDGSYNDYPSGGFSTTNYILVLDGYEYYLSGIPSSGSIVNAVSFYDENHNYISGLHYTFGSSWDNYKLTIPSGTKYIRLCKSDSNDYTLNTNNASYLYSIQKIQELQEKISNVGENIMTEYVPEFKYYKNAYISNTDGSIVAFPSGGYDVSEKFYIGPGKSIVLDGSINGSAVYGVAYYDNTDSCLGGVVAGTYNKVEFITPLNTKYVRFCKTPGTISIYVNIVDALYNIQLAQTSEGIVSDLQGLINGERDVKLPAGTFIIDTPLTIPNGTKISGVRGATVIKLGSASACINIINGTDITIDGITFEGSAQITPSLITLQDVKNRVGEGTETGVYLNGDIKSVFISNCRFKNFSLAGVRAYRTSGDLTEEYKITDCVFKNNWYGFLSDIRSEYNTIIGCSFNYNQIGAFVAGGNNNFACCHFDRNGVGYVASGTGGDNDSHGVISSSSLNHNTVFSVCCIDVNNGYIFDGCNIFEGDIQLQNSIGLLLNGCVIAAEITQTLPGTNRVNMIANCIFHKSYGGGTISDTTNIVLKNNHFADGSDASSINN